MGEIQIKIQKVTESTPSQADKCVWENKKKR